MDASYQLTAGINNKQEKYVQTRGIHAKQAKRHSQENITHTPQSKYQRPKSFGEFKKSKDSEGLWFKWQLEYIHPGGWRKSGCICVHVPSSGSRTDFCSYSSDEPPSEVFVLTCFEALVQIWRLLDSSWWEATGKWLWATSSPFPPPSCTVTGVAAEGFLVTGCKIEWLLWVKYEMNKTMSRF